MNDFGVSDANLFTAYQFADDGTSHLSNTIPSHEQQVFSNQNENNCLIYPEENLTLTNSTNGIPFVRIHAFETTSFNRSQNEIKPEPIKSELNDIQSHASTQATQTPPLSESATPVITRDEVFTVFSKPISSSINQIENQNDVINLQQSTLLKCPKCWFLCVSQTNLDIHISSTHDEKNIVENKHKISCPGCDNLFISKISLKSHLEFDHLMLSDDLNKFLESVQEKISKNEISRRKNRIYLKNVECLKEKKFNKVRNEIPATTLECSIQQISDTNFDFVNLINDQNHIQKTNFDGSENDNYMQPKQKITIKSVETLREPNYQDKFFGVSPAVTFQNLNFNGKSDQSLQLSHEYVESSNIRNDFSAENHFNVSENISIHNIDKQKRPPKIYIKNVDILKEPIFLSSNHISNILHVNETLPFTNFVTSTQSSVVSGQMSNQDCIAVNHTTCNLDPKNQHNSVPDKTNYSQDYNEFANPNIKEINYQNQTKICIKNDMTKECELTETTITSKKTTNYLHLRTVDELNLLDKTELNILNNFNQNSNEIEFEMRINETKDDTQNVNQPNCNENLENNVLCMSNLLENSVAPISRNFEVSAFNNCSPESLNLETNAIKNKENLHQHSSQYYDLNTPQRCNDLTYAESIVRTNTVEEETIAIRIAHESDLFICPEDFISYRDVSNSSFNAEHISIDLDSNLMINESTIDVNNFSDNIQGQFNDLIPKNENVLNVVNSIFEKENNLNIDESLNPSDEDRQNEKGRIYVSENLMKVDKNSTFQIVNDPPTECLNNNEMKKKHRYKGRPFGSKTLKKKQDGFQNDNLPQKNCDYPDCGFKFKELQTLEYHKLCHLNESSQLIQCPDCKSKEFSSWNTLHTHLWRCHKIDMDLYSCNKCDFKTPILSRLLNTHSKIHYDERNFKCDICGKAFKNSRQLKNHRRVHRKFTKTDIELVKCKDCNAVFGNKKSLKQHICINKEFLANEAKCAKCGKICSSKSYLKIHMTIHEDNNMKYICVCGDFSTNNPTSFKKHKARHSTEGTKNYQCSYCDYQSIQASLYKKHLLEKHPDNAADVIHQCSYCKFSTIRKLQFYVHLAKNHNIYVLQKSKNSMNQSMNIFQHQIT